MRRASSKVWAISLIGLLKPVEAHATEPAALAQARWNEGAHALAAGDLEAARTSFLAAYDAFPNHEIAQSLGEVEYRTHRFADAVRHLTIALDSPKLSREEQSMSKKSLANAMAQVGMVVVEVNIEGADILVDGELVGRSPLGQAWFLDHGDYVMSVHKDDFTDATKKVEITPGKTTRVSFALSPSVPRREPPQLEGTSAPLPVPMQEPTSELSALPSRERSSSRARTVTVVTGATLTVISSGIGSYFLVQRAADKNHANELRDRVGRGDCAVPEGGGPPTAGAATCQELANAYRSVDRDRNLAIANFAVAGVLGAATVATFFLWPRSKSSSATVRVAPLAQGTGIVVGGDF